MDDLWQFLNRPVFISGFNKSGTTLYLAILDDHPELVVIPEELNFFKDVLYERDKARAIREKSGFKFFLSGQDLPEWEHWRTWFKEGYPEFDQARFNECFERAVRENAGFKGLMLQMVKGFAEVDHIDPGSKRHWVSKTPEEEIYFPLMLKMFGEACKFVYIVRDPRDVYTSLSKWKAIGGKQSKQDVDKAIRFCVRWQTRTRKALEYQKKHANARIFRYEDLLTETERTLEHLCDFLEIGFSDRLLEPTRHGKRWGGNSAYSEGFKGLSKEPIGRYQKALEPERIALLESLLSKEMAQFGYALSDPVQADGRDREPAFWRDYAAISTKIRLKYFFDQTYINLRYNFPQFH